MIAGEQGVLLGQREAVMVRATFDALSRLHSPRQVAAKRGKKVSEIVGRRDHVEEARE